MIHQPDGSRACLNWELRGRGYHMVNDSEKNYSGHEEISDEELLKEAYRDLNNYNSKKENL